MQNSSRVRYAIAAISGSLDFFVDRTTIRTRASSAHDDGELRRAKLLVRACRVSLTAGLRRGQGRAADARQSDQLLHMAVIGRRSELTRIRSLWYRRLCFRWRSNAAPVHWKAN